MPRTLDEMITGLEKIQGYYSGVIRGLLNYSQIQKIREHYNSAQIRGIREQCLEIKELGTNLDNWKIVREIVETQSQEAENVLSCLFNEFGNVGYAVFIHYEGLNKKEEQTGERLIKISVTDAESIRKYLLRICEDVCEVDDCTNCRLDELQSTLAMEIDDRSFEEQEEN